MRHFTLILLATIAFAPAARAAKCPLVTIVLDRSGSMDIVDSGQILSRWDIAVGAITKLVNDYQNRLPLGFITYQSGASCDDFTQEALIDPKVNNGPMILSKLTSLMPSGGTNTGQGVRKGVNGIAMGLSAEPDRPGGYVILITDGEPFCPETCVRPGGLGTVTSDPAYTACEIEKGAAKMIKTFVVGFGTLPTNAQMNMNTFATAGGAPCMGAACNGKQYFAADSPASLDAAIKAITETIAGEFSGGQCDDSCYANGCPNAGEICVKGRCKADPCASLTTCAPGDYCYTDGTSPGTCISACDQVCPAGEVCTPSGKCQTDLCAGGAVTCPTGEVCKDGNCVQDACSEKGCDPGYICYQGACIDDPCRYVSTNGKPGCPDGHMCVNGTGACAATLTTGGGMGGMRKMGGCDFSSNGPSGAAFAGFALLLVAFLLRLRRRT
jgi:MYXO-CTERM domain-containing protein